MSRRIARETAMHICYQMEIHKEYELDLAKKYIEDTIDDDPDKKYIDEIINIFIENKESIDNHINNNLQGWDISRLSKIDLAILRIGLAEILFRADIPVKVSINEAIELGKRYGTDDSANFISGLLGAVINKDEIDE